MPDVLHHERAAAWTEAWMAKHPVKKSESLDAMDAELRVRLRECEKYINANHKVGSVCGAFPDRIAKLKKARGERLRG